MPYCHECGSEIQPGDAFCNNCGADLTDRDLGDGQDDVEKDDEPTPTAGTEPEPAVQPGDQPPEADAQRPATEQRREPDPVTEEVKEGRMSRRKQLAILGGGIVVVGGGVGAMMTLGGSSGPQYDASDESEMHLTTADFPTGWERNDEVNENYDRVFTNQRQTIAVLVVIEIKDTVGEAKNQYSRNKDSYAETYSFDLGDQSFWASREEYAVTLFRDSNAIAQVAGARESGTEVVPDKSRSQQYATDLYQQWQSV